VLPSLIDFSGAENLLKLKDIGKAAYPEDSSEEFDERVFFQKDQNGGTTRMLNEDFVCDHLPNGLIHNNSVVTRIDRTVSPAELTATRWPDTAAACTQDYEVKYVIVTMPQNVLIQEQSTIFNPELSINNHPVKQNIAEKVWFQWDNPWWDQSKQWIVVANGKQDGKGTLWLNYNHPNLLPGSNLLMTFLDENQLDAMGGSVVIPDMLEAGLENLPGYENSSSSYKTDWMNDPFARGGWEIWELGKTYEDFDEAIEPQGILHLAGAAHCRNFFGFTWGAIFSGIFSAEWVAGRLGGDTLEAAKPAFNPCFDNDGIKKAEWQGFYAPYDWFCVPQNTK
jgi:monoamine oxidase